ncbi:MAG: iron-sulfur cluster insertion protein ErpA [Hyphomicrobiales bacterium]
MTRSADDGNRSCVSVTDRAAQQIAHILNESSAKGRMLRVSVLGGGCSGFQYGFDIETGQCDGDLVIEKNGASVVIDELSLAYLKGSEIDFVDELIGASFKIKNPNATASCGCGTSFSI